MPAAEHQVIIFQFGTNFYRYFKDDHFRSYPSLVFYGPDGIVRFQGVKEEEELIDFVVKNMPDHLIRLRTANFEQVP